MLKADGKDTGDTVKLAAIFRGRLRGGRIRCHGNQKYIQNWGADPLIGCRRPRRVGEESQTAYNERLTERVMAYVTHRKGVEEKRMFGGISLVTAGWGNRMASMDTIRFDSLVFGSSHSCLRDKSFR